MNKAVRFFLLSFCCLLSLNGMAQEYPRPPAAHYGVGPEGGPGQQLSPEERMERREENRQRRDSWRQMSPEERHRLRSDIRDAGRSLYPGRQRGRDMRQ
ncbi:MAG: hypothetical protein RBS28_02405 [Rhodocyclaceae bacterium]|jgi:hypothetical protein|nr:hypothetical protein [Rhodocyclaceae bacterium]